MKRRLFMLLLLGGLLTLLTSCADLNPLGFLNGRSYSISLSEPAFIYEADLPEEGGVSFTVDQSIVVSAQAAAGSIGATFTGYRLDFEFADGSPVLPGDSSFSGSAIGAYTPPGLSCPTTLSVQQADADDTLCTVTTPGVKYTVGAQTPIAAIPGIPNQIVAILFCDERPDVSATGVLTLYGRDDIGREFDIGPFNIPVEGKGSFLPPNFPRPPVCTNI